MQAFTPRDLFTALKRLPTTQRYWISYSGGCDSHVLLHAMASLRADLPNIDIQAVHIDHSLQAQSQRWSEHCKAVAQLLAINCEVIRVDAKPNAGESPEAAARDARYDAITPLLHTGDILLTAHHRDDQAETVLLQLLRGAGPAGLAAMPAFNSFGKGWLARPLLNVGHAQLVSYAEQNHLDWIDDASNFDIRYERNFIRHQIMPVLRQHWPATAKMLARAASHSAEATKLLREVAVSDLSMVKGEEPGTLSVSRIKQLDDARQRNVLRQWISDAHLPRPSTAKLHCLQHDMLHAAGDRNPHVTWSGAQARRYRDTLYVMPRDVVTSTQTMAWDINTELVLPNNGVLKAHPTLGQGLSRRLCEAHAVSVRFRQGGEHCRLAGQPHSQSLKHLFQEHAIPPWQRNLIPLIYIGENLAAIAGRWICQPFQSSAQERGITIEWAERGKK